MRCNFCSDDIPTGGAKIFVTLKGNALYFCSKKCEKNQLKLRRKARKVRWTKEYRKEKEIRKKSLEGEKKIKKKPDTTKSKKSAKKKPETEKVHEKKENSKK